MCGIVGYIGRKQAAPILLDGLEKLEYRGYDSAGLAVYDGEKIQVEKSKGRLAVLWEMTHGGETMRGTIGIGHTRWATHGEPSDINAHPQYNENETIAVVHNGIIENHDKLRKKLTDKGYVFKSDTDTEVVANLLDYYYKGDALTAVTKVMHRVEGSYALGILFADQPDRVYAVRKDSPLVVGSEENGSYIASDVPAILKYTRNVYYIENQEVAVLTENDITFYNLDQEPIQKESHQIEWDIEAAEKGGYEHFMLKEMYEQPKTVTDTISPRIKDGEINIEELDISEEELRRITRIHMVACGSAYHTAVTSRYIIEEMARIPVDVDLASEFKYRDPIMEENDLFIAISQSGETADTKEALVMAKERGIRTLAIVNVVGSSIAREADMVMYTHAGPEIAVATTKAYTAQLVTEYLLAIKLSKARGRIDAKEQKQLIKDLKAIPAQIESLLSNKENIQKLANRFVAQKDIFFIGRGIDYAISLEASLKLKEISYIHSEAYAAGELKHGTISLVEEGTLVAAVMTREDVYDKTASNLMETRSRGATTLIITNEDNADAAKNADYAIFIPKTGKYFTNSLAIIPLQLFAYYVALGRGCDVDKPRNLAKSVTVE